MVANMSSMDIRVEDELAMSVRQTETGQRGALGEVAVEHQFTKLGWGVLSSQRHDLGTDLFLLARDHRRFDLGQPVGAQVKTGGSWFREEVVDQAGEVIGWWFRDDNRVHLDYWAAYAVPHLLVLHNEDTETSFWVHVTAALIESTGNGAKIFVPRANRLDLDHRDALLEVAVSKRPAPMWEGSAWARAEDIPPEDRLRYALVAPRLVAPHRNAGVERGIGGEEVIALLIEGRGREIARFAERHAEVPALDELPGATSWTWRFVGAIHERLHAAEVDQLIELINGAPTVACRAAATVVAAASLLELARPDEALALIESEIARDECAPVDHAWLGVQLARALIEIGNFEKAREAASEVLKVRVGTHSDATATAFAGVAAVQLHLMAPWGEKDTQAAVEGMDTAVAWWRTERVASGTNAVVQRQYEAWTRRSAVVINFEDVANNRLLTAALLASLVGDHARWRHLSALNAKQALLQVARSSEPQSVSRLLHELRNAGDDKALAVAVRRLVDDGPAAAVAAAMADLELSGWTRTTCKANLALLRCGGDVLDAAVADRVVSWLLTSGADLAEFVRRTQPNFDVVQEFVNTLAGVVGAAPFDRQAAVAELVLGLPPQGDDARAAAWSAVVEAVSPGVWTEDRAARAVEVTSRHHEHLGTPLLAAVAHMNSAAEAELVRQVGQHSLLALSLLSTKGALSSEVVDSLTADLATRVAGLIADARSGSHSDWIHDFGRMLVALNIQYPENARWEEVYTLLQEPLVAAQDKRGTCIVLAHEVDSLPQEVRERLSMLVSEVATGPAAPFDVAFRTGQTVAGPAALLAAKLTGDARTAGELLARLLGGDATQRAWAAWLAPQVPGAAAGVLAGLTNDEVPMVRAAAAVSLLHWSGSGTRNSFADEVLRRSVEDPGTLVARRMVTAAEISENVLERLAEHRSAEVRNAVATRSTER